MSLDKFLVNTIRGSKAEFSAANPILAVGEMGIETDTGQVKFGTGLADWNSLQYVGNINNTLNMATLAADSAFTSQFAPAEKLISTYYFGLNGSTSTMTPTLNDMIVAPLWTAGGAINRLGLEVTTLAAGVARIVVYNPAESGLPGTLLIESGAIDCSSTGIKTSTVAATLPAGLVWVGVVAQTAAASFRSITNRGGLMNIISTSANTASTYVGLRVTGVTGAAPGTFGTPDATPQTSIPRVILRAA